MKKQIEIILGFRNHLLSEVASLTTLQLNHIPEGYNNNIVWQLGHMNAVLQLLCYRNAYLPLTLSEDYFLNYLPGTKPQTEVNYEEIEIIKIQFITVAHQLNFDLQNVRFDTYCQAKRIKEVFGIDLSTIDDALSYLIHHEGIHFNSILHIKRLFKTPDKVIPRI